MYHVEFTKTFLRKMAEGTLYFWGVAGMIFCFLLARQAYQAEFAALATPQIRTLSLVPAVIMYILIWIGGIVLLGFLASLAPVKVTLNAPKSLTD